VLKAVEKNEDNIDETCHMIIIESLWHLINGRYTQKKRKQLNFKNIIHCE